MNFSVSSSELQKNLGSIVGVVPSKSTLPILENFLFDVSNDSLKITATDLEVTTTVQMSVSGKGEGKIAIPARKLLDTVRALPSTTISFSIDRETNRIQMRTENGEYKLTGESSENYPTIPEIQRSKEFTIDNESFRRLITKTSFAVSTDELRPAMMGILLQIKKKEVCAVATDGHRLVRLMNNKFSADTADVDVVVPAKAMNAVVKCLEGDSSTVSFDDGYVMFSLGSVTLTSRLIEEKYPNYESVIPLDNDKKLIVDKNQLLLSVRRTSLYASATTHQVRFALKKNQVTVSAEDVDFGSEAKETLKCDYASEAMEIGFNAAYIIDILSHIDTEEVEFSFSTPTRAAIVKPFTQHEGEELLMLVMPVRLTT
jgi:DNA polymerase-3 subunit beta